MDILKKNYFETFGLPIAVDIDHSRLEQQFTNLQKQFHPDKYNSSSGDQPTAISKLLEIGRASCRERV